MTISAVTAFNLKEDLEQNKLCTTEIVRYIFKKISLLNAKVNAYTTLFEAEALSYAEKLDSLSSDVKAKGRLNGIPIAISSNLLEEDNASLTYRKDIFSRIKGEGAIILGTTSKPANNPWNTAKSAGYMSGGAAAAVAAGMASLAISVDDASSIIESAAFCGVLGFKPSLSTSLNQSHLEDNTHNESIGIFARNTRDCALFLDALSYDAAVPYAEIYDFSYKGIKIAVIEDLLSKFCDQEIKNSVELSIDILKVLGFNVDRISIDTFKDINTKDRTDLVKKLFTDYEVILCPSTSGLPQASQNTDVIRAKSINVFDDYSLLSLPCGFSCDDLPIGLKLISNKGNDIYLLQIAASLEKNLSLTIL
jgi:aspartyl-tRNA(Asn)/glutamyl-tRNA(Gln) amidotransferase subunit A